MAADNFRVRGQFAEAEKLLNDAIRKDPGFCEAYYRLALVHRSQRNIPEALKHLRAGLAVTGSPAKQKIFFYELGDLNLVQGAYKESLEAFDRFLELEKSNKFKIAEAMRFRSNALYAINNFKDRGTRPMPLSDTVNRFLMQYFPVLTADEQQLFFTRRNGATDRDTEDIVVSVRDSTGKFTLPVSVSSVINTPENEGTCTVSADGRLIIFTSCRGRAGFGNCDLFESRRTGDKWSEPKNLGPAVNSSAWESQPSLSADGRELYFVSDRRGGYGSRDIYHTVRDASGTWMPAKNTGPVINTKYDEISPFLHASGKILFFASNGRPGFGGYDIYFSHQQDSVRGEPVNFGSPVNNHEDQFSLFITADGKKAYYSHEVGRDQNTGRIYALEVPEELRISEVSAAVSGRVTDEVTGSPIKARVELVNLKTNTAISFVNSDSVNGKYLLVLTKGSDYGLFVSAPGYLFKSHHFNLTENNPEQIEIDIRLSPVRPGSTVVLQNIFFDYDSYALKNESFPELEKVLNFLRDNPSVKIEVSGHTDNTGQEAKNKSLSVKRATSVSAYLTSQGIPAARIHTEGYGSVRPLASNETPEGRSANRRIEFRVLPPTR